MPRPRSNTADLLLDVAEKHFAERGYEAASLNDIAADVGIRTPSLYSHFKSKQALYEAVFERLLEPFFKMFAELGIYPADTEQSRRLFHAVMVELTQHPNLVRLIQYAVLAGGESTEMLKTKLYQPLFKMTNAALEHMPEEERLHRRLVFTTFHSMVVGLVTFAPVYSMLLGENLPEHELSAAHLQLMESMVGGLDNFR